MNRTGRTLRASATAPLAENPLAWRVATAQPLGAVVVVAFPRVRVCPRRPRGRRSWRCRWRTDSRGRDAERGRQLLELWPVNCVLR